MPFEHSEELPVTSAGNTLRVLQLQHHQLLYQLPQIKQGEKATVPYWAGLWPGAEALCLFLESHSEYLANRQILEIGAGLGLPAALAGHYSPTVTCTDADAEAVAAAAWHMQLNGMAHVQCKVFDWHQPMEELPFEVLLASDIHYNPADFDVLHAHIDNWLRSRRTIILSSPHRLAGRDFLTPLLPRVKESCTYEVPGSKLAAEPVTVYVLR